MKKGNYADVWGDTVDLKQLFIAIILGSIISLGSFMLTEAGLNHWFPSLLKSLKGGYALLGGMLGALLTAIFMQSIIHAQENPCRGGNSL